MLIAQCLVSRKKTISNALDFRLCTQIRTHTFMYISYPWTLNSHPSLGNNVYAVSFVELSHWKCICSSCVSKESTYLMLTSWDPGCKQTLGPLFCLKISAGSHGWMKEESERKKGRFMERNKQKRVMVGTNEIKLIYSWKLEKKGHFTIWPIKCVSGTV